MAEHPEGPADADVQNIANDQMTAPAGPVPGGWNVLPSQRAAALWKMLGDGAGASLEPPPGAGGPDGASDVGPEQPAADDELGQRLAQAWLEGTDGEPVPPAAEPIASQPGLDELPGWEVDALPDAASGGVLGLFSSPQRGQRSLDAPATGGPSPDSVGDVPASGRALLAEMIDQLPTEPPPRVGPDDVEIERPVLPPVSVWFWGDDDIYPGRMASAARAGHRDASAEADRSSATSAGRRRRGLTRPIGSVRRRRPDPS